MSLKKDIRIALLLAALCYGCGHFFPSMADKGLLYEDMTDNLKGGIETVPGKVYRMWETGICGTVSDTDMTVTHIIPGSVAEGKIRVGDILCGMQGRGMWARGGTVSKTVRLRLYRVGRDWDWHFYVTVERPSLRDGKGNTLTYDLKIPPVPGNTCHYGPTGFFAERHPAHLVVNVIDKGSPSDGKLMKGDVILAVDGEPITADAYDQFTRAVDHAESPAGKGLLKLRVRRTGKLPEESTAAKLQKSEQVMFVPEESTNEAEAGSARELDVVLQLKTFGKRSQTTPVDCPKTDDLISQTADYIAGKQKYDRLKWDLLGLLATGEEKYINVVREVLHDEKSWARPPADPNVLLKNAMYVSWDWGYRNLLLTEYYLMTGDEYVLPAITQLSRSLAAGQDQAGLWGHRMAQLSNGRAFGYGVMNQPSLSIFISLILAEKCGVKDELVRQAIKRTHDHFAKWIGVGALPYGNHSPGFKTFTNNGTSGSLAVAFALLGNNKGADFYARMSAAATEEILLGHGGPVWNILWSGLGANILGPEMAHAYDSKLHWLRTVSRTWNGRYVEMKGWGSDPKAKRNWETGCYLLNLCAGRRKIHITGKGMDRSIWVDAEEAEKVVEAGTLDNSSDKALLASLGHSLPPVRYRAAQELAMQDEHVSDEVLALLDKGTRNQKAGAIHAVLSLKIEPAVDRLLALALDEKEDLWVRQMAVKGLGEFDEAKKYAPKLLELLVTNKPYDQPYGELDMNLGKALVKLCEPDPYAADLDKAMFYAGVNKLLNHKHGNARQAGMDLLENIPVEDLPLMIDKMVYLFEDKDKTYTFYPGSGRQEVLDIFYRHGIKESMDYTVETLKQGRKGQQNARMNLLNTFGGEAKYLIPRIKEQLGDKADPIVKQIEESTTAKTMVTLDEFKRAHE